VTIVGVMLEQCPICQTYFDQEQATHILHQHEPIGPAAQRLAICNKCRGMLCTCSRCAACRGGMCKHNAPRAISQTTPPCKGDDGSEYEGSSEYDSDWWTVDDDENEGCLVDFCQARPWTWDDIREAFDGEPAPAPRTSPGDVNE
jgi:hypothetical protein